MIKHLSLRNKTDAIGPDEVTAFYQSKFEFYKEFTKWLVILAILSSVSYFYSDCQIFGRFAWETLLPRFSILLVLVIYVLLQRHFRDYRKQCRLTYSALNLIVFCTCWACHYLPDLSHVNEGLLIMQCMLFAAGFSAPFYYSLIGYIIFYIQIFVAAFVNHYTNLDYILSLGVPLTIGIILAQFFLQRLYVSHFKMELRLKETSFHDNLTGLFNRNYITEYIEQEKRDIFKDNSAVMILDIDFFKKVNDTLGHLKGDKLLQEIADLTLHSVRTSDYVIRWGGEEFVILMPNTTLKEATLVADRIRSNVERSQNLVAPVTISIGVAKFVKRNIQASVDAADKCLYQAKKAGRNRVVCQEA